MRVDIGAEFYVRVKPDSIVDRACRADARQPHQRRRRTARTDRGKIRRRPSLGRRHHEPRGVAGAARDLRQVGAGRGRRRHPEQRSRARIRLADAARPERHQAFQSEQLLRRPRSDDADQDHQGARAGTQPDRPHHRGEHRAAGSRRAADHADDRGRPSARPSWRSSATSPTRLPRCAREAAKVEQTAVQNEAEYRIQQELAVANKQTEANAGARYAQDRGRSRGEAPHDRNGARPADRRAGERDRRRQPRARSSRRRRPSPRPRVRWRLRPRKRSRPPARRKSPNATRSST